MENALIVNLLLGYHDYDYYYKLARSCECNSLEILLNHSWGKFLSTYEGVKKAYDMAWKLTKELELKDVTALSDESLQLLADLILEDICPD